MNEENKIQLKDSERQACEVWTRVMGYFRPVDNFNKGKKSEYAERKCFSEKKAMHGISDIENDKKDVSVSGNVAAE